MRLARKPPPPAPCRRDRGGAVKLAGACPVRMPNSSSRKTISITQSTPASSGRSRSRGSPARWRRLLLVQREGNIGSPRVRSGPQSEPHAAPSNGGSRPSSLTSADSRQKVMYCRIFTPAQLDYPAASLRDYCSGAYINLQENRVRPRSNRQNRMLRTAQI